MATGYGGTGFPLECGRPMRSAAAAALSISFAGMVHAAHGFASGPDALRPSGAVDVAVRIPASLHFALTGQPQSVEVSASDAAAGVVLVSGTTLALMSNDRRGCVLEAVVSGPFTDAIIDGLGSPMHVTARGVRLRMPSMVGSARPGPMRLRYRLSLKAGTAPGIYPWPVSLQIGSP